MQPPRASLLGVLITLMLVTILEGCGGNASTPSAPPLASSGATSAAPSPSPSPSPTVSATFSGTVFAPNGVLSLRTRGWPQRIVDLLFPVAPVAQAQANPTLQPVPGITVLAFMVDVNGRPQTGALASTTTDGNGDFALTVVSPPNSAGLALVLQAANSSVPQPVGTSQRLDQFAASTSLALSPASEVAARAIVAEVSSSPIGSYASFTSDRISALTAAIGTAGLQDSTLVGATIAQTVANLQAALGSVAQNLARGFDIPLPSGAPSLAGTFNVASYGGSELIDRESGLGTLTITGPTTSGGSSYFMATSVTSSGFSYLQTPGLLACTRTFLTLPPPAAGGAVSGTLVAGTGSGVFLSSVGAGTQVGISPDGNVIVIPSGTSFYVAVRQPTSAPTLSGGAFAGIGATPGGGTTNESNNGITFTGQWQWPVFDALGGTLTVNGSAASGTTSTDGISQLVSCSDDTATSDCGLTAIVQTSQQNTPINQTITVAANGMLGGQAHGIISPDASFFMLTQSAQLTAGLVPANGANNGTLGGTYTLAGLQDAIGASTILSLGGVQGQFTADGAGNGTLSGTASGTQRLESCGANLSLLTFSGFTHALTNNAAQYTVAANGAVKFSSDGSRTWNGIVSQNGNVLIMSLQNGSEVDFFIGVRSFP